MRVTRIWAAGEDDRPRATTPARQPRLSPARPRRGDGRLQQRPDRRGRRAVGRPDRGGDADRRPRARRRREDAGSRRRAEFHFDPVLKLMSTVDEDRRAALGQRQGRARGGPRLCTEIATPTGAAPLDAERLARSTTAVGRYADAGPARPGRRQALGSTPTPAEREERRARPDAARPGRDDRPAARRGRRGRRPLPRGGDPDHRRHRRPPAHRGRDRAGGSASRGEQPDGRSPRRSSRR